MKILILGGTIFLGRSVVESAVQRGHQVTLFNRGQHGSALFPDLEKIHGDRTESLSELGLGEWDAVIDTCGYVPRIVRKSSEFLSPRVGQYLFISSISVYAEPFYPQMDESAPVGVLSDESVEEINGETYGPLKALCENVVCNIYKEKALIIRPGLIVGPNDPTDRFTYWPSRIQRGGEVAAPGNPFQHVQVIDVRDLADWILMMVETRQNGVFNATGPLDRITMSEFLTLCGKTVNSDAKFTWLSEEFLLEQNIKPFIDFPMWVPAEVQAMQQINIAKAVEKGLALRPLEETIRATLAWDNNRPEGNRRAGLTRLQEEDLLRKWKQNVQMC